MSLLTRAGAAAAGGIPGAPPTSHSADLAEWIRSVTGQTPSRTQDAAQAAHGPAVQACYFPALSLQSRIADSVAGLAAGWERSLAWAPGHGLESRRGVMVATDESSPALDYKLDVLRKASGLLGAACCQCSSTARASNPDPTEPAAAEMADHDQGGRGGPQPAGLRHRVLDHSPWCAACVPGRSSNPGFALCEVAGRGGGRAGSDCCAGTVCRLMPVLVHGRDAVHLVLPHTPQMLRGSTPRWPRTWASPWTRGGGRPCRLPCRPDWRPWTPR